MSSESATAVITVGSSDVELSDAFRATARDGITQAAAKYLGQLTAASVHVHRKGHQFECTVSVRSGGLKAMTADCRHDDCYEALKGALQKVEKQLRRTKRALREDKATRTDKDAALRGGF